MTAALLFLGLICAVLFTAHDINSERIKELERKVRMLQDIELERRLRKLEDKR